MGVPTSEVGYTPAMPRREDHEVHKGHVVALDKKKYIYIVITLYFLYLLYTEICGPGSVVGIATGYGLDGSGIESRWRARFSAPVQTGLGVHPASCTMGTGSFPGVKSGRGVTLTPHPLLVPWSRKSRAIPLLSLWAVRPVQSLSACKRVHFMYWNLNNHIFYCFQNVLFTNLRLIQV